VRIADDLRRHAKYYELYAQAGEHLIPTPTTIAMMREAADNLEAFEELGRWALGEVGNFPPRPEDPKAGYWYWRGEFARKFRKIVPLTPKGKT